MKDSQGRNRLHRATCTVPDDQFDRSGTKPRQGIFLRFGDQTSPDILYVQLVEPGSGDISLYVTALARPPMSEDSSTVAPQIGDMARAGFLGYLKSMGFTVELAGR